MLTDEAKFFATFTAHRAHVAALLGKLAAELTARATLHDLSKLSPDEMEGFVRINRVAREHPYGSPEYVASLNDPAVALHWSRNSHHPEHPQQAAGIDTEPDDCHYYSAERAARLTVLDVIEMVCDWRAAWKTYGSKESWGDVQEKLKEKHAAKLGPFRMWLALKVADWLERSDP